MAHLVVVGILLGLVSFAIGAGGTWAVLSIAEQVWGADGYEPKAADPVDEHAEEAEQFFDADRSVPFVDSNHPTDCDQECCFEIRLTEKTDAFPWDAYEQELTK